MPFTTLETTNFPLYAVNALDREHFLIAGGGGAAKTGVPNALVCVTFFVSSPQEYYMYISSNFRVLRTILLGSP